MDDAKISFIPRMHYAYTIVKEKMIQKKANFEHSKFRL